MSTLTLKGTTSGSSVLKAPASGSNEVTFTMPATAGTLLTTTGSGANLTGLSSFDPDGAVVFNESSADVDFRVESNDKSHMLFVDGGTNRVGINKTGAPDVILDVQGTVSAGASTDEVIQEWSIGSDNVKANIEYTDVSTSRGMNFGTSTQHDLILKTNDTTRMTIDYNGKVHIPGHVLQVKNQVQATEVTSNSATYTDTGCSLSITPSSTTSKILVISSNDCTKYGADTAVAIRCYRDSTEIGGTIIGRRICDSDNSDKEQAIFSFTVLDSPNTTSAVTYKTQYNNTYAGGTVRINAGSGSSTFCLMEIGA